MKKSLLRLLMLTMLVASLALFGCEGDDGNDGAAGAPGAPGADGAAGPEGPAGPVTTTDESCNICHGAGQAIGLSIDTLHPLVDPKVEVANIVVASGVGATDTVTFDVFEEDGTTPVSGLTIADFRFYIADIVPAGTLTANAPVATWSTPYVERWLYERNTTVGAVVVENPVLPGNYTYTFSVDLALGNPTAAPEFNIAHNQRLMIRVGDIQDVTGTPDLSREAAIVEFVIPADGVSTGVLSQDETTFSRALVAQEACTNCHGDPLQSAAHGSGYQTPQGCVVCHTPIGATYGDDMQTSGFWLASLIHTIHNAGTFTGAWPGDAPADFSEVTYPKFIQECSTCHIDGSGLAQADSWKTNPTAEACATCHDVTFTGAATHSGGAQPNSSCSGCHPAEGNGFGQSVTAAHDVAYDLETQAYNVTISLSPDANADGVYEVGETILVTATSDLAGGFPYTSADTAFLRSANLYVYGPRALAVPVLTPGSTTDPAYVAPTQPGEGTPPDQGRSMLASDAATDANVLTDADGFKYQLLEITEDMAAGTYMVQTNIDYSVTGDRTTDGRHIGPRLYPLDGWQLVTFQVGTATEELKVAGECTGCHDQRNFSTFAHRSYFGTDGCLACHDQSGNHADPLSNRTHAVHAASVTGDLLDRDWSEITFPRNLNASCAACHNSGSNTHRENPVGSWGYACIGCHGDTEGAFDHMLQNGAPFIAH
ncbi:MAG: multiheme c-type cytochrome [Desulfuromonadales bacterium]